MSFILVRGICIFITFTPKFFNPLKLKGAIDANKDYIIWNLEITCAMTTLKITVNNRKNARLLTKLLKSMAFVKKVEEDLPIPQKANQLVSLKNFLNTIEPESMFRTINNPVEWQKEMRNEWETR